MAIFLVLSAHDPDHIGLKVEHLGRETGLAKVVSGRRKGAIIYLTNFKLKPIKLHPVCTCPAYKFPHHKGKGSCHEN